MDRYFFQEKELLLHFVLHQDLQLQAYSKNIVNTCLAYSSVPRGSFTNTGTGQGSHGDGGGGEGTRGKGQKEEAKEDEKVEEEDEKEEEEAHKQEEED